MILAAEIIKENSAAIQEFTDSMMKFFYGNDYYENNSSERYIGNREQPDQSRQHAGYLKPFIPDQNEPQNDSSIVVQQNYFWIWHSDQIGYWPIDSDTEDGEDIDSTDSEEERMYRNR